MIAITWHPECNVSEWVSEWRKGCLIRDATYLKMHGLIDRLVAICIDETSTWAILYIRIPVKINITNTIKNQQHYKELRVLRKRGTHTWYMSFIFFWRTTACWVKCFRHSPNHKQGLKRTKRNKFSTFGAVLRINRLLTGLEISKIRGGA